MTAHSNFVFVKIEFFLQRFRQKSYKNDNSNQTPNPQLIRYSVFIKQKNKSYFKSRNTP